MEVVTAEVLADTVERRHVDRDLCALQLDGFLRRLARQEAPCRRVLVRLARTFLAGHYHHRLGFARLSDYTRERLGLSARQVQDLARVAERLESLPAIAAAFAAGDLSWPQTRLPATAATAASEREWLAPARAPPARPTSRCRSPWRRRPTSVGLPSTCRSPRTWKSSSSSDPEAIRSRSTSACGPPGEPCSASTGRWASSSAPSSTSTCTAPSASRRRPATSPSASASRPARRALSSPSSAGS